METLRRSAVLLATAALLAGCASVREAGRERIQGDRGGVRVAVYQNDDARAAGRRVSGAIAGTLEFREEHGWVPVFRSLDSSWTVAGLAPGRYRVRFDEALDAEGRVEGLERPVSDTVDVKPGEIVKVEVILDHVSPAMVAAGAAAVVVAAVLLHEWLDDLDLPSPPSPPDWALDTAFYVTLDFIDSGPPEWVPRERAPQVTSHFPRQGDRVAAERIRIVYSLSEPIDLARFGPDAITVATEDGAAIPGRAEWDAKHWWVIWTPDDDLPAGARLTATLHAADLADTEGVPLVGDSTFGFSTAP
jgi:hypothetical protein